MGICCMMQGTQRYSLWQPRGMGWGGRLKREVYTYGCFMLAYGRNHHNTVKFSSVQSLSRVQLFATTWTAARQASLPITNSQSLLKFMSTESVIPSNHLILCRPLLFPPSIILSIRVFSNESVLRIRWPKYWSFDFNISPSIEWIIRTDVL